MNRTGRLVLVALCALAVLPFPASASSAGKITLVARGNAYIDIRLAHRVTLDLAHLSFGGGGTFGGVFVRRLDAPSPDWSAVLVRSFQVPSFGSNPIVYASDHPLEPGRYRFFALSDKAVTVTVPTDGANLTLHPLARAVVSWWQETATARLDAVSGRYRAELRHAMVIGAHPFVITAGQYRSHGRARTTDFDACLAAPSRSCDEGDPSYGFNGQGVGGDITSVDCGFGETDVHPGQRLDADVVFAGIPAPDSIRGFALSLDAGVPDHHPDDPPPSFCVH